MAPQAAAFLLAGAPCPVAPHRGLTHRCLCTRRSSYGLLRWRSSRLPPFVMSTSTPPSSAADPSDDDDKDEYADSSPPPVDPASSLSSGSTYPPPAASQNDDDVPPPPLDYSALAARIAALPTADEVVDGGTVHRFDTIEAEDAAGYAAAYRSAVSLFLLLVGDSRGGGRGGGSGGGGGVGGGDVYALAVGRDRVALVFATRNDAVLYGRMMLAKGAGAQHRRVRVAVRCRRKWVGVVVASGVWQVEGVRIVMCGWVWPVHVHGTGTWQRAVSSVLTNPASAVPLPFSSFPPRLSPLVLVMSLFSCTPAWSPFAGAAARRCGAPVRVGWDAHGLRARRLADALPWGLAVRGQFRERGGQRREWRR